MLKKLIPAYILSFVISFMIWIYEPITMYANNLEDLWFDFSIIIGPLLIVFLLTFIVLSGLYSLIYFINLKKIKRLPIYKIVIIISFVSFLALYIQGNFLVYNLPPLDGSVIDWNKYKIDSIISGCLWGIIIILTVIFLRKKGYSIVEKGYMYLTLAVFAILSVSFITTLLTTNVLKTSKNLEFTMDNFGDVSKDKNFYIFLVDAVDSLMFKDLLNKSEYKDTFNDFTYYPDTMAAYPFTRDSIPFILSGIWNENEDDFITYFNKSMDKSRLIKSLKGKKYSINLYDEELVWNTKVSSKSISNITTKKTSLSKFVFYRQEAKYFIYKYFPYFLKRFSYIETMDYVRCKNRDNLFSWKNKYTYDYYENNKVNKISDKYFSYIHLEGGHFPFDTDENLKTINNGTYHQKLGATLKVINKFINRLKENDAYDNSVIIVMSDHGYSFTGFVGRQNPILFIKGIDEHHDMINSDIPVSYEDLNDAYLNLLEDKKSTDLFSDVSKDRKRRFLWYKYTEENHMVEYEQTGYAWDEDTLVPTGKEFNR